MISRMSTANRIRQVEAATWTGVEIGANDYKVDLAAGERPKKIVGRNGNSIAFPVDKSIRQKVTAHGVPIDDYRTKSGIWTLCDFENSLFIAHS